MSQRTSTVINAELTDFRAARAKKVNGERVTDVWRDGRRMRMSDMSMDDFDKAIASLEREYDQAVAVEAGGKRRRSINLRWPN